MGVDASGNTTLFIQGPLPFLIVRSDGNKTTERTKRTVESTTLDEDPSGTDEIAAVIKLEPLYPTTHTAQSATVTVSAP